MANHKIGDWYPFSTVRGILDDPKTTVSVGAMIYLLAGELRQLDGFSLNTEKLIAKLDSTANYIGNYNSQNEKIDKIILDPNKNRETVVVNTLPHILASKQLQSDNYNSRCLYRLSLNINYIIKTLERRHPTWDRKSLKEKALEERNSKFEITLSRDLNLNKEAVEVERIINLNTGEELDEKFIKIEVVSLKDEKGYWLDTGQFILSNQSIN